MLKFLQRRFGRVRDVRFCDACAEVCTPECRSQTRLDTAHVLTARDQYLIIR